MTAIFKNEMTALAEVMECYETVMAEASAGDLSIGPLRITDSNGDVVGWVSSDGATGNVNFTSEMPSYL